MSAGIVDADKLPLSVAAALLATEAARYTFVVLPAQWDTNLPNDFCQLSFSLLSSTELQIGFIMSCGLSSFYDFI